MMGVNDNLVKSSATAAKLMCKYIECESQSSIFYN